MPINRCLLGWLAPLALAACGGSAPGTHDHGQDDDHGHDYGAGAHGHPHEQGDDTLVYTDYTDVTELFVEFPALVVGQPSTFAAHVTRLSDYTPLTAGRMDVVLEASGRSVARFRVRGPARTGIFTPAVTARQAGTFDLVIEVVDGGLQARHALGPVTVFADAAAVRIDQPEKEGQIEGNIGYLKEQQWTNPFAAMVAAKRPLRPSVPGFATVMAPADAGAEIRAPSDGYVAAGRIAAAGESVKAGAVLGHFVPRLGDSTDIGSLQVALERARAQATLAERDIERLQDLFEKGAIAERRLLEAREAHEVAQAELRAARSRLEQYQQGDARAGIALRSPVAGEVIEANAQPGAFVRAGERLFRIAGGEKRWLEVRVPERFAAQLPAASGVWFPSESDEPVVLDEAGGARVVQTATAIDPATRTASVTIEYPAVEGPALVGARFAAHVFTGAPRERLAIARSAVIDDGGRSVVYVQTGGEMFVRRPVELGVIDGGFVEVLSGISAGERVVSKGAYYVKLAAAGGEEIGHGHAH